MPDLWPRSSADSCRDSCAHWPEQCKPTLITSFLSVPDKGSDTPDNLAREAEAHPGSLVISLSHREGWRADRLPRRKFPRSKREKRKGEKRLSLNYNYILSRGIRIAVTFVQFLRAFGICNSANLSLQFFELSHERATIFYRGKLWRNRLYASIFRNELRFFLRATTEPFF